MRPPPACQTQPCKVLPRPQRPPVALGVERWLRFGNPTLQLGTIASFTVPASRAPSASSSHATKIYRLKNASGPTASGGSETTD